MKRLALSLAISIALLGSSGHAGAADKPGPPGPHKATYRELLTAKWLFPGVCPSRWNVERLYGKRGGWQYTCDQLPNVELILRDDSTDTYYDSKKQ